MNATDQTPTEASVSVINYDYLPTSSAVEFPEELAVLIVRKAASMAATFEDKAWISSQRTNIRDISRGRSATGHPPDAPVSGKSKLPESR